MSEQEKPKLPRSEIQKMIDDTLKGGNYATLADLERNKLSAPSTEEKHSHKPEEFMPQYVKSYKCPDGNCGKVHDNPNFKPADTYCSDCGHAYGTVQDATKAESCPGCGSKEPAIYVSRPKQK